jgi:hypothetical protein
MHGFALGPGRGQRRAGFSPRALFVNGEQGAWYDPSDLASMFQDTAGTIPAAVGAPVARINDRSGRGNHAGQVNAAARPLLRQDSGGRHYLEFDGIDDRLVSAPFALAQPWDRAAAIRQNGWTSGGRLFANGSGAAVAGLLLQQGAAPSLGLFDGSAGPASAGAAIGAAAALFERHAGAASQLAVNQGGFAAGNAGSVAASGVSIGADPGGGNPAAVAVYGLCIVRAALGDAAVARLRAHFAARAGIPA